MNEASVKHCRDAGDLGTSNSTADARAQSVCHYKACDLMALPGACFIGRPEVDSRIDASVDHLIHPSAE